MLSTITIKEDNSLGRCTMETEELINSITAIKKQLGKLKDVMVLPIPLFMTLTAIKKHSADGSCLKTSRISSILEISRPATTQILNSLEDQGYIIRKLTPEDRRIVYVSLTESGSNALSESGRTVHEIFNKVVNEFGEENTLKLTELLKKLSIVLETTDFNLKGRTL